MVKKELIDVALARFDVLHARAVDNAHRELSTSILAFQMLTAMGIPPPRWPVLFMSWGGAFPTLPEHLIALRTQIRQNTRYMEPRPHNITMREA